MAAGWSFFPNENVDAGVGFEIVLSGLFFCPKLKMLVEGCSLFPATVSNVNGFAAESKKNENI